MRRPGPLPFAGLATVVGLQFLGGHPSSSFQVMVCVALFWLVRALTSRPLRASRCDADFASAHTSATDRVAVAMPKG